MLSLEALGESISLPFSASKGYLCTIACDTLPLSSKLLLLSRVSHVRLCATPWTAAYQASPSMGFSRQEHWSGCHFLLQCMKVESESEVTQSCLTLSNPMDLQPTRLLHPWDFPGNSTGVGCHCLL